MLGLQTQAAGLLGLCGVHFLDRSVLLRRSVLLKFGLRNRVFERHRRRVDKPFQDSIELVFINEDFVGHARILVPLSNPNAEQY